MPTINISFDSKTAELESVEVNGVVFIRDTPACCKVYDLRELVNDTLDLRAQLIEAKELLRRYVNLVNTNKLISPAQNALDYDIAKFLEAK